MKSPLYLCGPTASGKSSLAVALAEAEEGEIVNADAFQGYRGLEILSAAPTKSEKARCPHHLYSYLEADQSMNAATYAKLAQPLIAEIQSRGKLPIVVGGSGLYLKFLTHGMAAAPAGNPEIRAQLDQLPVEEVYRRLAELDPAEAARQNSKNHRHLSRALEICLLTGQLASDLRQNFENSPPNHHLIGTSLTWPRDDLAARIATRTERMLREGAIAEVQALPENASTIRQAIGVREIETFLRGEMTANECQERIIISTRQYAKRQRNWFRREAWLVPVDGRLPLAEQVTAVQKLLHQSSY